MPSDSDDDDEPYEYVPESGGGDDDDDDNNNEATGEEEATETTTEQRKGGSRGGKSRAHKANEEIYKNFVEVGRRSGGNLYVVCCHCKLHYERELEKFKSHQSIGMPPKPKEMRKSAPISANSTSTSVEPFKTTSRHREVQKCKHNHSHLLILLQGEVYREVPSVATSLQVQQKQRPHRISSDHHPTHLLHRCHWA